MSTKPITIPINLIGPGSQPDKGDAMTIGVPDSIETFTQPATPEVADKTTARQCRDFFIDLYREMKLWNPDSGEAGPAFALDQFSAQTLGLINQMLGEGEVSIKISIPNKTFDEIRIQESIFVGVWRVRYFRKNEAIADQIEISAIPACVAEAAYLTTKEGLNEVNPGDQAMNSPAVLAELKTALAQWQPGAPTFTVNLSHLPMTDQDHEVINEAVGDGAVHMMSRSFGNCHIQSTATRHVWRIQFLNNAPTRLMILNTLVVCGIPDEAIAASEDLKDSMYRVKELIEWVTRSWELDEVNLP